MLHFSHGGGSAVTPRHCFFSSTGHSIPVAGTRHRVEGLPLFETTMTKGRVKNTTCYRDIPNLYSQAESSTVNLSHIFESA
eukprot:4954012-Amphidinium_carterae.1